MPQQLSFAELEYQTKKRSTRRELFLAQMEKVVPWESLLAVVEPHYPRSGRRGRPPMGLELMLRIYCMQQWFSFSDRQMEDALYEIESVRRFAGFTSVTAALPDETTILMFRHLLETHRLTEQLLTVVNDHLKRQGLLVSKGTMVDATIVPAASSTKNKDKSRDPEMHQTKKGNQWYFGMKLHVGADVDSGAAHSVTVSAANTADISELPKLLRAEDQVIFGDAGYASDSLKRAARKAGVFWGVALKSTAKHKLTEANRRFNRKMSSVRSR